MKLKMRKIVELDKLVINPENYRFDPVETQDEAIDLMLEEKGNEIFNMAKHIVEYGLDEAKNLRVTAMKKDLYKILEGNRRITALKCLHNPSLIKNESLKNKFLELIKEAEKEKKTIPKMVNCFVYGDEVDAAKWVKLDHTGKNEGVGLVEWGTAEKNRFAEKFEGKLSPAMQAVKLYEEVTKSKIDDPNELNLSTIDRILSNPESRSYIGLGMMGGEIYPITSLKEVGERLDKLFNKMLLEKIPVKEFYNTELTIKFIKNLYGEKPKPSKGPVKVNFRKEKKKSKKRLPKSNDRNILIPNVCDLEIKENKINNIYHELMEIPLAEFPNAVGVLFRVFLETSLDYYIEKYGISVKSDIKLTGKITKVVEDLENKKIATSNQLKNINNVASKRDSILSIDNFHEYVHSFKVQPTPMDLIIKWDSLEEFFDILWEEISKKEKTKK